MYRAVVLVILLCAPSEGSRVVSNADSYKRRRNSGSAPSPTFKKVKTITKDIQKLFVKDASVKSNWFLAKDNFMFSAVTEKARKGIQSAPEMLALVTARSEFICKVILGSHTKSCLHNEKLQPRLVQIPAKIQTVSKNVEFTEPQQKCTAQALGSVTYLSDLDFTVSCSSRKHVKNDTLMQQASDEIDIAEKLTEAIEQILGTSPGTIFDTNFYTNTYSYGPSLAQCGSHPHQGLAIGLYAMARGFMQVARYASNARCQYSWNANPSGLDVTLYNNRPTAFLKALIKANPRMLGKLRLHAASITDAVDFVASEVAVAEASRTSLYFHTLREAIADPRYFCIKTAFSLILANEAYWVPGAIKDVVQQKQTLTGKEAAESVFMNLGYAMEHVAHEFAHGDSNSGDVMKCNYGDGLIKLGKYISRVQVALTKAQKIRNVLSRPGVQALFATADDLKAAKQQAGQNTQNANALPQAYVQQYQRLIVNGEGGKCGVLHRLASVSMAIVEAVNAN